MRIILKTTITLDACGNTVENQILAATEHHYSALKAKFLEILTQEFQKALADEEHLIAWDGMSLDDEEEIEQYKDPEIQAEYLRQLTSQGSVVYTIDDMSGMGLTVIAYEILNQNDLMLT